jgi:hypothetical protein
MLLAAPMRAYAIATAEAADSLVETVRDWQGLHRAYPELSPWDDGYVADGISDFVVQRLAKHWESFSDLATITRADTTFGTWVVLHIDATTDWDDLARIVRHAGAGGPRRDAALRQRVLEKARQANDEAHRAAETK